MKFLEKKHKTKSAIITSFLIGVILFLVFNFGMQYLDPPVEYGVAVNFGDADLGQEKVSEIKKQVIPKKIKTKIDKLPEEAIKEDLITNNSKKEAPVVEKKIEKPKPSKETQDALNKLLNPDTTEKKGKGDDDSSGNKGDKSSEASSNKYYGLSSSDGNDSYNLGGRKALSKPIQKPDCQEEGIVVVSITVNKEGKVIAAVPGVKGTTNSALCLLKPAKEAALKTTWNIDKEAPLNQKGTIIYKFTLSK